MLEVLREYKDAVPTPVGVNLCRNRCAIITISRPHARGGEPSASKLRAMVAWPSPRPWG